MNPEDSKMIVALARKVSTGTLAALAAMSTAYALGVAREITDHARQDPLPTKESP